MEYDRTDISEGIDTTKTDGLCKCIIYHYWNFVRINFRFQPEVNNGCRDMKQKSMNLNIVAIVVGGGNCRRVHFEILIKIMS